MEHQASTLIGVCLAIVGSSLIGISYTASKTAHNRVLQQQDEEQQPITQEFSMKQITKQPIWYIGLFLLISGEVFNFAAYGYAPTSLISPLGALSIVSGAVSGSIYLQERIKIRNIFGMVVTCIGACIIVVYSKSEERQLSPEAILEALSQITFLVYISVTLVVALGLVFLDRLKYKDSPVGDKYMMVRVSLTATFSGFTVLATKGLSSLLNLSLYHIFGYWITYVLLIVLITNALLTLFYTNKALSSFDSTKVLPAEFASFTLSAVMGSAILYNDFDRASPADILLFLLGCSVTFFGVFLITSGQDKYGKNVQLLTGRESMVIMAGSFLPPLAIQAPQVNVSRVSARPQTYAYGTSVPEERPRDQVQSMHGGVVDILNALSAGHLGNAAFQQLVNPPVLVAGDSAIAYEPISSTEPEPEPETWSSAQVQPELVPDDQPATRKRVLTRANDYKSTRDKIRSLFVKLGKK